MKNKIILLLLVLSLVSTFTLIKNKAFDYGNESGLPFDVDDKENNRALLFTMTDEPGRTRNIQLMKSVFEDGKLGFQCESYHNKTAPEIYANIKQTVSSMDPQGTLLLYLNSHGGGNGSSFGMTTSKGWFKFSKVLESIASVKKLKRIVVLVDTCHAEGAINEGFQGGGRLIKNVNTAMFELPDSYGGHRTPYFMSFFREANNSFYYGENSGAYEELLIVTSSSAADLSMRGTFALNLKKAFDKVKIQENPTVLDLLRTFALLHSPGGQQPYYKCIPTSILNEQLFKGFPARSIPIVDKSMSNSKFKKDYILVP